MTEQAYAFMVMCFVMLIAIGYFAKLLMDCSMQKQDLEAENKALRKHHDMGS